MATLLFFMYVVGRIIVAAPILNAALNDELETQGQEGSAEPEDPRP